VLAAAAIGALYTQQLTRQKSLEDKERRAVKDSIQYAVVVKSIRKAQAQRDSVVRQLNIIKVIDNNRFVWPHVMDEVSRALPPYTWLTSMQPATVGQTLAAHTTAIWSTQVRFLGAGTIAVAAVYTLIRLARPVVGGLVSTLAASRAVATSDDRDRDLAPSWIFALTAACLVVAAWLAYEFARSTVLAPDALKLTMISVPFVLIIGFVIAGVCGYMAGLIGASNSPISGVGILSIVVCASVFALAVTPTADNRQALVAVALFVTAIVFACATISNDNLQDLKTGQLVGASPMRQQIALIVGVAAGASVIPFVLNLLARAYGFAGAPNVHVVAANPLPAPQATLIAALAQGVIGGSLEWKMLTIGALVGVGLVILRRDPRVDEETAHPTAGSRNRYLPADVGDFRGDHRCGTGALVRSPGEHNAQPGPCAPAWNSGGVRSDRRREHLGRNQRRPHRRLLQGCADRAGAGELRAGAVARIPIVRCGGRLAVRVDAAALETSRAVRRLARPRKTGSPPKYYVHS